MTKIKNDVRHCPLLKKICIKTDCGWYMTKLNTCAVQVLPYNLFKHSSKLEECSRVYNRLLDYIIKPERVRR